MPMKSSHCSVDIARTTSGPVDRVGTPPGRPLRSSNDPCRKLLRVLVLSAW